MILLHLRRNYNSHISLLHNDITVKILLIDTLLFFL